MDGFSIIVVTDRPAVRTFFCGLQQRGTDSVVVRHLPLQASTASTVAKEAADAVVVIDAALDPPAAIALCQTFHAQRADSPLVGLLCCPAALTPWQVEALLAAGVRGLVDLRATAEEALYLLHRVVRGACVLHVQLSGEHVPDLGEVCRVTKPGRRVSGPMTPFDTTSARLLALVAQGQSDAEIGDRLCLSPHTIKHHIERLRDAVGVGNRVELAAWAGRHGFYHAGHTTQDEAELDQPRGRNRPGERADSGLMAG